MAEIAWKLQHPSQYPPNQTHVGTATPLISLGFLQLFITFQLGLSFGPFFGSHSLSLPQPARAHWSFSKQPLRFLVAQLRGFSRAQCGTAWNGKAVRYTRDVSIVSLKSPRF